MVHAVVDERVDHCVGHGEPVEGEVEVLHVAGGGDLAEVVRVDEVAVVRQPAHGEDGHDHEEHAHHPASRRLPLRHRVAHAPQLAPHAPVAHGHGRHRHQVRQHHEHQVVPVNKNHNI